MTLETRVRSTIRPLARPRLTWEEIDRAVRIEHTLGQNAYFDTSSGSVEVHASPWVVDQTISAPHRRGPVPLPQQRWTRPAPSPQFTVILAPTGSWNSTNTYSDPIGRRVEPVHHDGHVRRWSRRARTSQRH